MKYADLRSPSNVTAACAAMLLGLEFWGPLRWGVDAPAALKQPVRHGVGRRPERQLCSVRELAIRGTGGLLRRSARRRPVHDAGPTLTIGP